MPPFSYKAITATGEVVRGWLEAPDAAAVLRQLRSQGLLPVETAPAAARRSGFWRLSARAPAGPRTQDLALAVRQLVVLLSAGLTLEKSLQSLAGGAAPERLRPLLTTVLDRLRGGRGLAEALEDAAAEAKKPLFPPYFIAMIRAGEAAGALEAVLGKLAELLERALRLRETLISALIYPIILTVVAISSVVLLLTVVVPQFAPLFANSPHQLPWATTLVLGASRLLREWGALGISLLLAGGLAAPRLLRRWGASGWWDRTVLRLPVAGPLVVAIATARLSRTLGILLKSGVPLPAALGLTRGIVGNRVLAEMLDALRDGIANGRGLTASLPEGHPLPDLAVQLLRVGEQSGRLEEILLRLADLFDDRVELAQKRLLAIFEPACVLTLSAIVGGIVISILQAVVSINDLAL